MRNFSRMNLLLATIMASVVIALPGCADTKVETAEEDTSATDAVENSLGSEFVLNHGTLNQPEVSFSPSGDLIATVGDGQIVLWDARTGEEVRRFLVAEAWITSVDFSVDGTRLAASTASTWDDDPEYAAWFLWDLESGQELLKIEGHETRVHSVQFSHDGTKVVTTSEDNTVRVWDAGSGEELLSIPVDWRMKASFNHDDTKILVFKDNSVDVYDAETGTELASFDMPDTVSIAFGNGGRNFAVNGSDGISVFNTDDGSLIHQFPLGDAPEFVAMSGVSRDGSVVIGHGEGGVYIWDSDADVNPSVFSSVRGVSAALSPDLSRVAYAEYQESTSEDIFELSEDSSAKVVNR